MNKYEMECVLRSAYYEVLDKLQIEDGEPDLEIVDVIPQDKLATGVYLSRRNTILIKEREDLEEMIETLCHEVRHIWQRKRYGTYFNKTYAEIDPEDFDEYWNCEFEVDAREFANKNYRHIYDNALEECSYLFE